LTAVDLATADAEARVRLPLAGSRHVNLSGA
jgi:hypothetical protein